MLSEPVAEIAMRVRYPIDAISDRNSAHRHEGQSVPVRAPDASSRPRAASASCCARCLGCGQNRGRECRIRGSGGILVRHGPEELVFSLDENAITGTAFLAEPGFPESNAQ